MQITAQLYTTSTKPYIKQSMILIHASKHFFLHLFLTKAQCRTTPTLWLNYLLFAECYYHIETKLLQKPWNVKYVKTVILCLVQKIFSLRTALHVFYFA